LCRGSLSLSLFFPPFSSPPPRSPFQQQKAGRLEYLMPACGHFFFFFFPPLTSSSRFRERLKIVSMLIRLLFFFSFFFLFSFYGFPPSFFDAKRSEGMVFPNFPPFSFSLDGSLLLFIGAEKDRSLAGFRLLSPCSFFQVSVGGAVCARQFLEGRENDFLALFFFFFFF